MVRTAGAGIRVSGGRSSKKSGKGSGASIPTSKPKSGSSSSSRLPAIPFQETPSWQKPITNFFKSNSPLKDQENNTDKHEEVNAIKCKDVEQVNKKLKLDTKDNSRESNCDYEETTETQESKESTKIQESKENTEVQESEENNDNETCKEQSDNEICEEIMDATKENTPHSTLEFDKEAGSSKD